MVNRSDRKKGIIKLADSEDLYSHFGEEAENSPGFVEEFAGGVSGPELEEAVREKRSVAERKTSFRDLISSYPPPHPQDELDLHSLSAEAAERRIRTFIWEAARRKSRVVRIITGKGLHSDGPAVLPDVAELVLQELKSSDLVLHYQWENKSKLKSGSVIVYLQ